MPSPIDYLRTEVAVWKFFGLFDIDTDSKWLQSVFKIYCIFFQSFYIYLGCSIQSMAILNANSMKEAVEFFFISIAYYNAAIKFCIVYYKRKQVQKLWETLEAVEFRTIREEENVFLPRALFFIRQLVKYYTLFGALNMVVLVVTPILRNVHELPFPMWTPFDVQKSLPFFYFMYAFQFGVAVYAGGTNLAVNMFMYSTLVMMEFCLNLLGARLMRLGHGDRQPINTSSQHKASNYREIVNCVQLQLQIESVAKDVHKIFNNLLYVQVLQSAFLFANSGFFLIAVELSVGEFAVPFFWLSTFLAEMSIYCYFGNNIIYAFRALSTKAFFSNFIAFEKKSSKAFLQVLHVLTAREMSVKAVGLISFELSLETLLKILKTTYSIIMLINSM